MQLGSIPSISNLLWSSIALFNAIVICGTVNRLYFRREPVYTYLNRDYPLTIPVGPIPTVEMTFHDSSHFALGTPLTQSAWQTLVTNQAGIGFQHLGPFHFRFISTSYHALHCLYKMQQDYDKPHHREKPSPHFQHCLLYLRQVFLCNADMTLEEGDFMRRNWTLDRVVGDGRRRCRDWSRVADWIDEEAKVWMDMNGLTPANFSVPLPD